MATDARRGEISRETPQTDLCETSGVDWTRDAVVRDLEASTSTDTNAAGRNRALVAVPAPGERAESDARASRGGGLLSVRRRRDSGDANSHETVASTAWIGHAHAQGDVRFSSR